MKKVLIVISLFLLTGCTSINKSSIETIVSEIQLSKLELNNTYRKGYKYYMPTSLKIKDIFGFNEKIIHKNYKYYLYVDIVSYFNKIESSYEVNPNAYISQEINKDDIKGYLEVNSQNGKYLIEIMYNYAKIELIVDENYLKEAIANSLVILSTIKYNDDVIKNMMGEDILNFSEEVLNIFEVHGRESNFLEYVQEYDTYEDDVPDPDLIN